MIQGGQNVNTTSGQLGQIGDSLYSQNTQQTVNVHQRNIKIQCSDKNQVSQIS